MTISARYGLFIVGLATAALSAPAAARGQEPRLVGRLADSARVQVDAIVDSARADGLPTEPIVDRALEGAAMGASGGLVVRAVRRLWGELRTARDAFGATASPGELSAGASALRAGAAAEDLEQLRMLRPDQPLTVAAGVLADLVAVGVPADTAVAAVLTLAAGVDDATYVAFRRNVERDIALGASPGAALGVRLSAAAESELTMGEGRGATRPRRRKP